MDEPTIQVGEGRFAITVHLRGGAIHLWQGPIDDLDAFDEVIFVDTRDTEALIDAIRRIQDKGSEG